MPTVIDNQVKLGEYRVALPAEQTINFSEVEKAFNAQAAKKLSEAQRGEILEKFYRQPVMAGVYRKNGIEPNKVKDFIKYVKEDYPQKDVLIDGFYGAYGLAAHSNEGFKNGKLDVEGTEWKTLESNLKKSITINSPMRQFIDIQKQKEKEMHTASSAIKDLAQGAKIIATGFVVAIAGLTPLGQRLIKLTEKEDMQKVEARQKQLAQKQNIQKTANIYISKDNVKD